MKIETLEQLSALPDGTVLRDRYGDLWNRDGEFWYYEGRTYRIETLEHYCLPATALIPSVISQEQLAEVRRLRADIDRVKAEAWDEGWDAALSCGTCPTTGDTIRCGTCATCMPPNPYRKDDYNE